MFNINLGKIDIPELIETKGYRNNYYHTNANNSFFEELIKLYEQSSIHNSFVNNLTQKVIGSGMISEDEQSQNVIDNMNINELYKKTTLDYNLFGGFAIEVIWNVLHTKITEINYIDFTKIRSGFIDEETEEVKLYYYSYDWTAYHKKVEPIQSFDPDPESDNRQIYYYKGHHPGTDIYPRPMYLGGIKYVTIDVELSKYYANLVANNFVGNTIINIPNGGNMGSDKQVEFEEGIKKNFTSSENAGSIVVLYGDGENEVQLLEFAKGADDAKYQWLTQQTIDQLVICHRIPNPLLAGVRVPGSLAGTQELETSNEIYNNNVVYPTRNSIVDVFGELNTYFVIPIEEYEINDIPLFNKIEE